MATVFRVMVCALVLVSCGPKNRSARSQDGDTGSSAEAGVNQTGGVTSPGDTAAALLVGLAPSPAGLRVLSRTEIGLALQDLLGLEVAPRLSGYNEVTSKTVVFRNAAGIVPDGANLRALDRAIGALLASVDWDQRSLGELGCRVSAEGPCLGDFLKRMGTRAWRRPLTEAEQQLFIQIASTLAKAPAETRTAGLTEAVRRQLIDHRFLFRQELGQVAADGSVELLPWEKLAALNGNSGDLETQRCINAAVPSNLLLNTILKTFGVEQDAFGDVLDGRCKGHLPRAV